MSGRNSSRRAVGDRGCAIGDPSTLSSGPALACPTAAARDRPVGVETGSRARSKIAARSLIVGGSRQRVCVMSRLPFTLTMEKHHKLLIIRNIVSGYCLPLLYCLPLH